MIMSASGIFRRSGTSKAPMQLPENARYELSGGTANERSDLVPGGSASAETAPSLQRKAACRSENLHAAF